jgi:HSP20 family molecular chaperone IbpA
MRPFDAWLMGLFHVERLTAAATVLAGSDRLAVTNGYERTTSENQSAAGRRARIQLFAFLRRLTPTMERLITSYPSPMLRNVKAAGEGWLPNIDVFVREGTFVFRADRPGLSRENVEVGAQDDFIAIKASARATSKRTATVSTASSVSTEPSSEPCRSRRASNRKA